MFLWRPVWFRVLAEMVRFPIVERLYQNHFCWRMSRTGISRFVRFLVNFSEVYAMSFAKRMRGIAILFALAGFICAFSACSGNTTPQKLSELDETALLQRLADYEVVIPANLEISAIRDAIAGLEADPDRPAPVVGWVEVADFYEELRSIVKEQMR